MHVLLIEDNEDDAELIQQALCERSTDAVTLNWADRLQTGIKNWRNARWMPSWSIFRCRTAKAWRRSIGYGLKHMTRRSSC